MSHYSELTSAPARRGSRHVRDRAAEGLDTATNDYDTEAMGSSYEETTEWDNLGIFGAGLAVGLTLGAGLALLLAPRSGEETRELLGERSRWVGDRVSGGLDDIRYGVERATRRSRRKLHRGLTRGRWVVEDMRG
ncbi:MAG TPA: YtxH domain-containing protein [Gemmatimonadaceae bacterium]